MSRSRRVVHGLGANYFSLVIKTAIRFLVTPFYLARLGPELMGLNSFISEIIRYFDVLDFGIGTGLSAIVARDLQPDRPEKKREQVEARLRAGAQFQLGLAAIAVALAFVIAWGLGGIAEGLQPKYLRMGQICTVLFGLNFAIYLSSRVYRSILIGHQLIAQNTIYSIVSSLLGTAVGVLLVELGYSLYGVTLGALTTAAFFFIQSRIRVARLGFALRPHRPPIEKQALYDLAPLSGWILLSSIGGLFALNSARILLGISSNQGMDVVNQYSLMVAVPMMLKLQANRIAVVVRPGLTQLIHSSDGTRRSVEVAKILVRVTGLLGAAAFVGIIIVNGAFVSRWVGDQYFAGDRENFLLACLVGFSIWTFGFKVLMEARFNFRSRGIALFCGGLVTIVLSVFFAREHGIQGVLWAAIIGECFAGLVWFVPSGLKWIVQPGVRGLQDVLALIWVPAAIVGIGLWFNSLVDVPRDSWIAVFSYSGVIGVLAAGMGLMWLWKGLFEYRRGFRPRL